MYRRTYLCVIFAMENYRGTGLWDEDHVNDYITQRYLTPYDTLKWYQQMEMLQTSSTMHQRRKWQTDNNNNGLHHSGKGAFERELERRGIPVDKYPLTTTTGATRVAELVQLRRQQLEKKASQLMSEQHAKLHRAEPSSTWYNEQLGPLNPRFLRSMQWRYDNDITQLPETPFIPPEAMTPTSSSSSSTVATAKAAAAAMENTGSN